MSVILRSAHVLTVLAAFRVEERRRPVRHVEGQAIIHNFIVSLPPDGIILDEIHMLDILQSSTAWCYLLCRINAPPDFLTLAIESSELTW